MKKAIAAALLVCATQANAEFITGNRLLQLMQGTETEQGFALGYVAGVFDVGVGVNHCAPANVTLRQVTDVVKLGLEKLALHRDKSADSLALVTLKAAWPCKPQQQSGKQV